MTSRGDNHYMGFGCRGREEQGGTHMGLWREEEGESMGEDGKKNCVK